MKFILGLLNKVERSNVVSVVNQAKNLIGKLRQNDWSFNSKAVIILWVKVSDQAFFGKTFSTISLVLWTMQHYQCLKSIGKNW